MSLEYLPPIVLDNSFEKATYTLTGTDKDFMAAASESPHALREPNETVADYILRLGSEKKLPQGLETAIEEFANNSNEAGGLLLRGFEIDVDGPDPVRAQAIGERSLLSVAMHIGRPYGYASQRDGEIIQNLSPKRQDAFKQLGTGSATTLEWHTEDAHTKFNCDIIALLCLRGAEDAATLVSKIDPDELDEATRTELERPDFVIRADDSYLHGSELSTPVLSYRQNGMPEVRFDPLYTECPTPRSKVALSKLEQHINERARGLVLQKGDLFLVDNGPSVHARSPFSPRYDGKDRWLQRAGIFQKAIPSDVLEPGKSFVINL